MSGVKLEYREIIFKGKGLTVLENGRKIRSVLVTKEICLGIRMCPINSLFIIFQPEVLDLLPV